VYCFSYNELFTLSIAKPIMAQIKLTNSCNQNCIFCLAGIDQTDKMMVADLSKEDWFKILSKLKMLGIKVLNFTGGETTLYGGLPEILSRSKKMEFNVVLSINGLKDISIFKGLIDKASFSVHGIGDIHNDIVGFDGAFDLVLTNIQKSIAVGIKSSLNMVLLKDNYDFLEDVYYFFSKFNLESYSFTVAVNSSTGFDFNSRSLIITKRFFSDYLKRLGQLPANKITTKHGLDVILYNCPEKYTKIAVPLPNCAAGKYKLVIEADGSVYPCNFFRTPEYYCGNILHGDVFEIWQNGQGFQPFRRLVLEEKIPDKCQSCIKKRVCFSGCRAWTNGYKEGGFYNEPDSRCELGDAYVGA